MLLVLFGQILPILDKQQNQQKMKLWIDNEQKTTLSALIGGIKSQNSSLQIRKHLSKIRKCSRTFPEISISKVLATMILI